MAGAGSALPGRLAASGALLLATAAWGSTFVVTKSSLGELGSGGLPALALRGRGGGAAAGVGPAARGAVERRLSPRRAAGPLLGVASCSRPPGLQTTSAGLSGFLTGSSVVMVPVVASVVFSTRVRPQGWLAVGLSAAGLVLLTAGPGGALTAGALLTLAGAAGFAGHITALSSWATPSNAVGITTVSVVVAAVLCGSWALRRASSRSRAAGTPGRPCSGSRWWRLASAWPCRPGRRGRCRPPRRRSS